MRLHYIIHADVEGPGVIYDWASKHGYTQSFSSPFRGEELPSPEEFDMLVVMGGPQSPLKLDKAPYLKDEIDLLSRSCEAKKTVLGFCLGAQLLGEALGAATEHSPHKEIGFFPITLSSQAQEEMGWPEMVQAFHWHNDMPGLTREAEVWAKSEGCPRQILLNVFEPELHCSVSSTLSCKLRFKDIKKNLPHPLGLRVCKCITYWCVRLYW